MNGNPRRFIFNRYRVPDNATSADIYTNDPVVQLDEGQEFLRTQRQRDALHSILPDGSAPDLAGSIFGDSLDWAYREYSVARLSAIEADESADLPLGNELGRPVDADARRQQLGAARPPRRSPEASDLRICLFNVIIATEWIPTRRYVRQLEWGMRRASDFLYDATDGRMAFGQVVIGGPEWLNCADIQLMASNRLLPRAWVSGLHENKKYMPIRGGRGVWHKDHNVTISWDEPEAYRTLVHEWAHYALELRDEYLEHHDVFLPPPGAPRSANQLLVRGTYTLMIPTINLALESIMNSLQGTSELVPSSTGTSRTRRLRVWDAIKRNGRFPFLDSVVDRAPLDGPDQLPLPLPRYSYLGDIASAAAGLPNSAPAPSSQDMILPIPTSLFSDHCWVYLIHGSLEQPTRVIAQGTLDARTIGDGFRILGAQAGSTVVLIASHDSGTNIFTGVISGTEQSGSEIVAQVTSWNHATPTFPLVDLLPNQIDPQDTDVQVGEISVRVISKDGQSQPDAIWLVPLGQLQPQDLIGLGKPDTQDWTSPPQAVPTLDGHVLMHWSDGKITLSTFSQGGGPQTHIPSPPNAITGGSSEGNVMLFFSDPRDGRNHSNNRIVTTLLHGVPNQLENGAMARSYAFSIAGNMPLATELTPTLVMYFDADALDEDGEILIHRYDEKADEWKPIPTYIPAGAFYAAAPLNAATAPHLTAFFSDEPRVERYRLYLVPHASAGAEA